MSGASLPRTIPTWENRVRSPDCRYSRSRLSAKGGVRRRGRLVQGRCLACACFGIVAAVGEPGAADRGAGEMDGVRIENSLRYTPAGGRLALGREGQRNAWRLTVDDSAPGGRCATGAAIVRAVLPHDQGAGRIDDHLGPRPGDRAGDRRGASRADRGGTLAARRPARDGRPPRRARHGPIRGKPARAYRSDRPPRRREPARAAKERSGTGGIVRPKGEWCTPVERNRTFFRY